MKKLNLLFTVAFAAMALSLTSCKDECKDVVCENGGTCSEGICTCPTNYYGDNCQTLCLNGTFNGTSCSCDDGYEGTSCSTLSRDQFISSYSVAEVCGSGSDTYSATISASSSDDVTILISNFYNTFDNPVRATVSGTDLTIASQSPDNDLYSVAGSGSINSSGTQVTITFSVSYPGANPDNCSVTYTKQ